VLAVAAAAAGSLLHYVYPIQVARNFLLSLFAPPSTTATELNAAYKSATTEDWPSSSRGDANFACARCSARLTELGIGWQSICAAIDWCH